MILPLSNKIASAGDLSAETATPHLRHPTQDDGAALWTLARDSGALDLNSPYAYLMMAHWFSETCLIAEQIGPDGSPVAVGFVMGFSPPGQPDTFFVWQVAVAPSQRGRGLAQRMIDHLLGQGGARHQPAPWRYIEATVTPSNAPSDALFRGVAKRFNAPIHILPLFEASAFPVPLDGPNAVHEGEDLYRIGPISPFATVSESRA